MSVVGFIRVPGVVGAINQETMTVCACLLEMLLWEGGTSNWKVLI